MQIIDCQDASEFLSLYPLVRAAFRVVGVLTPRVNRGHWGIVVDAGMHSLPA